MKSMTATAVHKTAGCMTPVRRPTKTCYISLCSLPFHCDVIEIPFLKCLRPGKSVILQNWPSSSAVPSFSMHHLTRWSLNMPLCNWWRIFGVKHEKMLVWGDCSRRDGEQDVGHVHEMPTHVGLFLCVVEWSLSDLDKTLESPPLTYGLFGEWGTLGINSLCSKQQDTVLGSQQGWDIYMACPAISTQHINSFLSCFDDGVQDPLHTSMEQSVALIGTCLIRKFGLFCNR